MTRRTVVLLTRTVNIFVLPVNIGIIVDTSSPRIVNNLIYYYIPYTYTITLLVPSRWVLLLYFKATYSVVARRKS